MEVKWDPVGRCYFSALRDDEAETGRPAVQSPSLWKVTSRIPDWSTHSLDPWQAPQYGSLACSPSTHSQNSALGSHWIVFPLPAHSATSSHSMGPHHMLHSCLQFSSFDFCKLPLSHAGGCPFSVPSLLLFMYQPQLGPHLYVIYLKSRLAPLHCELLRYGILFFF